MTKSIEKEREIKYCMDAPLLLNLCLFAICTPWSLPTFSTLVLSRKKSPMTSESAVGRSRGQKKTCFHASCFFIAKLLDFAKEGDEG